MDFEMTNEGSLYLLTLLTDEAKEWGECNVGEHQTWAGSIVVEPRYAESIAAGLLGDGFSGTLDGKELRLAA